ncbi:MAG: TIGR04190 family B12-binding domain/radical SAM domain protein [Actinobacteria bacterium]|nr:TIGR04190 family B12-binding domain/radical SAM domain protein [Actinomycetota bacterium]
MLLKDDLVLLHAPSVYDFRKMLRVPSPVADLVPSGPVFEMYPVGFPFMGEYLERHGIRTRIVNLAVRMLENSRFDARRFISHLKPEAFGIDLHWLPHCHGAIEIARLCKELHPEIPVILGGYSATILHRELMEEYPEIDFIVRGDSTEEPLRKLMSFIISENCEISSIPNLVYRSRMGTIAATGLETAPADLSYLGNSYVYMLRSALRHADIRGIRPFKGWWSYPITTSITCRGCSQNCYFCGGAASTMKSCLGRRKVSFRTPDSIGRDIRTIKNITGAPVFIIGDLMQGGRDYAWAVLEEIGKASPRNHIVFELFKPAPVEFFEKIAGNVANFDFEISPQTHDEEIRGQVITPYGNRELENNLEWCLEAGCGKFDVFFMIGLSGQTAESVMDTVDYCDYLLEKFGIRLNPLIGPFAPFVDPCSPLQVSAGEYGFKLLFESVEEHRSALTNPNWRDWLGYETKWLSRQGIVDVTYEALLELNRIKGRHAQISPEYMENMEAILRENIVLLGRADRAMEIGDLKRRRAEMEKVKIEADELMDRSLMVKEEIEWPVSGPRFRYFGILRLLVSSCINRDAAE